MFLKTHQYRVMLNLVSIAFKLEILPPMNQSKPHQMDNSALTSYSQPAIGVHPRTPAFFATSDTTPRGHTDKGLRVSGSKKDTRKKGTLFSQGILRYVARSISAITSR